MVAMPAVRELPWLKPSHISAGAKVITDPQQAQIAANAEEAASGTDQLKRNWRQGTYTIDTPRTKTAMGWIGGKKIRLSDVELDITTRNATLRCKAWRTIPSTPLSTS
jgi:hypothetical protein